MSSDILAYNEYSGRRQSISLKRHRVCKLGLEMFYEVKPVKKSDYEYHRHPALLVFVFILFFLLSYSIKNTLPPLCVGVYVYELKSHIYLCVCAHACICMIKI